MAIQSRLQPALEVFNRYAADAKIVLLHPANRLRNVLLASLIADPDMRTFYYSFNPDDINLRNFISGITKEMFNQHATFGRHINLLKSKVLKNPKKYFDEVLGAFLCELMHDGSYYRINPNVPFYYDACEFVEALMLGRYGEPEDPFAVWQRLVNLYRGPFLQGHNEPWILERREAYQMAYIEALVNTAAYWARDGKPELALHNLRRALDSDYANEAIHTKLLRLYDQLGRRAEAVAHYRTLEKWAKSSKLRLSGEVQQLFSDIMA